MTEDERLERINRAFGFVPYNLYDEITKLAEYALGEYIKERDDLADALRELDREIRSGLALLQSTTAGSYEEFAGAEEALRWVLGEGDLLGVVAARAALDRQEQR